MKRLLNPGFRWGQWLQRCMLVLVSGLLISQVMIAPAYATSADEIPKPELGTWVVDQAEILSRSNEGKINAALSDLAKQTGNEVHLVTIHRLDYDVTIEQLTQALFQQWFPTPAAQTNQTLLVLDNLTNNSAIVTGDQAQQALTPAIADSVTQETILVPLKQGNKYNQAMADASDRLVAVLSGRPDPGPPEVKDTVQVEGTFATPEETKESNATFWVIGFLVVATVVPMATYYFYLYLQSR